VKHGVKIGLLNEALLHYDMAKLGAAIKPERDLQFGYLGLQTLYDRYFLVDQYVGGRRFELPQCFFMRVAMGLALNEVDREAARHRVLQRAVHVRLHVEHAHALQLRARIARNCHRATSPR
jgi:ribonucleotide reductase alpha subunit